MARPVAGLWAAYENGSEVYRYITLNGMVFQYRVRGNMIEWVRLRVPSAARSGIAAMMGMSGGRVNPDDAETWENTIAELGGLPDMVMQGFDDPTDEDMRAGWKRAPGGDCYRVVDDETVCLAGFLGCGVGEVDDVLAAVDGVSVDPEPETTVVEPEPETAEIPEVPPQTNTDARVVRVSPSVIPLGVAARDFEPFQAFNRRPRAFRDAAGRKRVYVCFTDDACVVAVRDGYTWGTDAALEREVAEYLSRYGWTLAA